MISVRLISRLKMTEVSPCLIDADRAMSSPSGRLADSRARGEDDHLAGVQSVGQPVEIGETGRYAGHHAVAVTGRLDLVDACRRMISAERQVVLGSSAAR